MKGSAIGYGGILAMLIITTFVFMYITAKPPIERYVITSEGALMNFANEAEMLIKTFDTSVEFISQRSAYELGLTGGLENEKHWTKDYPDITTLEEELEKAIENNLPASNIKGNMKITFSDGDIDTTYSCGSIESSRCFLVDGSIFMNFYDNATKSVITLNSHEFDATIASNYFRLLKASRSIMEESEFNSFLENGDLTTLSNAFKADSRFANLRLDISVSGSVVEFTMYDRSCLSGNDYYCIAPLKAWETGIINPKDGKQISYDYVKLKFKVDVENAIAPEGCARADPSVTIVPDVQAGSSGSTLTYNVFVKNNDGSDCDSSLFSLTTTLCPSGWVCDLENNFVSIPPGSTDDSSRLFVTSTSTAGTGLYTFTVRATNTESAKQGQNDGTYSISACSGSFSATISGTGTCTVYTSFSVSNCNGNWEIREGSSVKKSGTVLGNPYTNNPTLTGVSTGDHTYELFIGGNSIGSVSVKCSETPGPAPECYNDIDCNKEFCKVGHCISGTCSYSGAKNVGQICGGTRETACSEGCTVSPAYPRGVTGKGNCKKTCDKVCQSDGSCSCDLSSSACFCDNTYLCSYACNAARTDCAAGIYCQPATAMCRNCLYGSCGDGKAVFSGGCYAPNQVPAELKSITCSCWTGSVGIAKVVSTCSACNFDNREMNCNDENNGCEPTYNSGCQLTSCSPDASNCTGH
jgi:hypothetical protein